MRWMLGIVCAVLVAPWPGFAQSMRDPMQPPGAGGEAVRGSATPSSGLQAIVTSPRRKLAVIDGEVVPLGASVRAGQLVGVTDSAAVLRKNGSRDVVLMHPEIEKKPSRRSQAGEPKTP